MSQRITIPEMRTIYTNLQLAEPSKFKNLNDNKMTRKVIGDIVFILKSIYMHAYPNKPVMSFGQICKVFIGSFTNQVVTDFWKRTNVFVYKCPDTIVLIKKQGTPDAEDEATLSAAGINYEDIEWEVIKIHDCFFKKAADGSYKRFYQ